MNWKDLMKVERNVRLTVMEENAYISEEFKQALRLIDFAKMMEMATFEVTFIYSDYTVNKHFFASVPDKAYKKVRNKLKNKIEDRRVQALRVSITCNKCIEEVMLIVRRSFFFS